MSACPACGVGKTQVIDSRFLENGWTRRRRRCTWGCGDRWNTFEIPESLVSLDSEPRPEGDKEEEEEAEAEEEAS